MSPRRVLIGKRNSTYQVLASLASNRQNRHKTRTFLVEGVQPINTALVNGWYFAGVVYERGAVLSRWAQDVIARAGAADLISAIPNRQRSALPNQPICHWQKTEQARRVSQPGQ